MRASRKHARARCCRTLASSSRSAPARRRCARIAVAGGGGGAASSMRARLALVMTQPPATAPTLTLRRRRCVPRGTTSGLAVLRTTSIFFCGVAVGWFLFAWCSGGCCTGGRLAPARGREAEGRSGGRDWAPQTHARTSLPGFSFMNFKFKPFSIQAGIACMREVMSSILIISITRGDIAQLVERLLSINAYFFFELSS